MSRHETRYSFIDPYQLKYLERAAAKIGDALDVTVIPTDTPEEIEAAAREWSEFEEKTYYLDEENAFDYMRRTDQTSYERLMRQIPEMVATYFLIKEVQRNADISHYELMREYYEPSAPKPEEETTYSSMKWDLLRTFEEGGDLRYKYVVGYHRLLYQIAHDNPDLDKIEVVRQAWSLIPEVTSGLSPEVKLKLEQWIPKDMQIDKVREELAVRAIRIHEEREAERRISE
jgi:hypothetical protein